MVRIKPKQIDTIIAPAPIHEVTINNLDTNLQLRVLEPAGKRSRPDTALKADSLTGTLKHQLPRCYDIKITGNKLAKCRQFNSCTTDKHGPVMTMLLHNIRRLGQQPQSFDKFRPVRGVYQQKSPTA